MIRAMIFDLDCHFGPISQPAQLAARLGERAGIVEHGLWRNSAACSWGWQQM